MNDRVALFFEKLFKFLASLKLAIIVMSSMTVMSIIGTIVEARYDAQYAQKIVYHSPVMYLIFALLCINLINVMVDRLPWKPHHSGFIFAHVGIILLIVGSLVTRLYGIDGSLIFEIGQSNRYVMLPDTEFRVVGSLGTGQSRELFRQQVDFLLRSPHEEKIEIALADANIKVKDYYHYAVREAKVVPTEDNVDPAGVRVQLQNPNVNMTQWVFRPHDLPFSHFDLGPARIILAAKDYKHAYSEGNQLLLRPVDEDTIAYEVYTASKGGLTKRGQADLGDTIELGWMGMVVRVLNHYNHATEKVSYQKRERPTGNTMPAVLFEFNGEEHWLGLNSHLKLFTENAMYVVAYNNKLYDIGFDMRLERFTVGRYQGTNKAMSYESEVAVAGLGLRKISMNEPLKHMDLTFYQASFQEDERGEPIASILSVNRDPGRWMKYLGSLLIVLGTVLMFWFKRYRMKILGKIGVQSGAA